MSNCQNDEKLSLKELTIEKLQHIGIIGKNGKYLTSTNAFMLLMENTSRFAKVQCALFKGNDRDIFIDKKGFDGSIYEQLSAAFNFVLRHINNGGSDRRLFREDVHELPLKAIREMLANAVIHRSYLVDSKIQVSILLLKWFC